MRCVGVTPSFMVVDMVLGLREPEPDPEPSEAGADGFLEAGRLGLGAAAPKAVAVATETVDGLAGVTVDDAGVEARGGGGGGGLGRAGGEVRCLTCSSCSSAGGARSSGAAMLARTVAVSASTMTGGLVWSDIKRASAQPCPGAARRAGAV